MNTSQHLLYRCIVYCCLSHRSLASHLPTPHAPHTDTVTTARARVCILTPLIMSRHSKNACAAPIFSHSERSKLTYGTRSRRVDTSGQQIFDSCSLCLHTAEQPVMCREGHLYCKGCILESLATQKETNRLLQQQWFEQQTKDSSKQQIQEATLQASKLEAFMKIDETILKGIQREGKGDDKSSVAPAGYVRVQTPKGEGFVVDRALVSSHASMAAASQSQQLSAKKEYLPCFWTPGMSPTIDQQTTRLTAQPAAKTRCPASTNGHTLRLKQLKPVRWCLDRMGEAKESEGITAASASSAGAVSASASSASAAGSSTSASAVSPSESNGRPMCFACKKRLHNTTPMVCITKCGHVACKVCVDTLMKGEKMSNGSISKSSASAASTSSSSSSSSSSSNLLVCLECDESCLLTDLVPIVASTGFAATGNTLNTAKLTPAFRC